MTTKKLTFDELAKLTALADDIIRRGNELADELDPDRTVLLRAGATERAVLISELDALVTRANRLKHRAAQS